MSRTPVVWSKGTRSPPWRAWLYAGRAGTALLTIGLIAIAVLLARAASTPPILGADRHTLPGSIATLQKVRLGGTDQLF